MRDRVADVVTCGLGRYLDVPRRIYNALADAGGFYEGDVGWGDRGVVLGSRRDQTRLGVTLRVMVP